MSPPQFEQAMISRVIGLRQKLSRTDHSPLAIGYAFIGRRIGLRFTHPLFTHAARALPRITVSTLALITVCGGCGGLFVVAVGIDPLTMLRHSRGELERRLR
jgi:uncharacterized membrane protein AbrB (regulator of aidB expression)